GSAVFTENEKISGNPLLDTPVLPAGIASNNNSVTFRLTDDENPFSTPVTYKFGIGYTKNSDMNSDALYIPSMTEGIPVLYTTSADHVKMEYKTLPDSEWVQEVPLTALAQVAGKHTLKMENPVTNYDCVNLIEKSSGRVLNNFNLNQSYSFNMQLGQQEDFILQFNKLSPGQACQSIDNVTAINELPSYINVTPDQYGAVIRFNLSKPSDAVISVYNILGEKVVSDISTNAYDNSIHVDLATGQIYIVKVQTAEGILIRKLFH
ncbi:MAG TPA: T9SS type A sorting domain-containing protein, partial [Bacteroidia bacterium]|nr:T9SS type A sorting domain-containing protein [Bacteroidia bacterium]